MGSETAAGQCGRRRVLEVGGVRLSVHEWGVAGSPPLLLLHSLAGHSHWWDWSAPLLAPRHHVVALDLRGHGRSDWVEPAAYRAADHVRDIAGALDALGWSAPAVVGHSLGGYVGLHLAASHPDRVGALVVADSMMAWSDEEAGWAIRTLARPAPEFSSPEEALARYRLQPAETTAPAEWLRHLALMSIAERAPGVWQYVFDRRVFAHARPDAWPILPKVRCPALFVRGEKSPLMTEASWSRASRDVANGHAATVAGAFHHLILDDPAQFTSLITAWLLHNGVRP